MSFSFQARDQDHFATDFHMCFSRVKLRGVRVYVADFKIDMGAFFFTTFASDLEGCPAYNVV